MKIFAEIIDAPTLSLEQILQTALSYSSKGADVIDIGCQPDTPFPMLEVVVKTLKDKGLKVSVDSGEISELRRAAMAGADYVLSLDETSIDVVSNSSCTPILVPKPHGDLASLLRAIDKANDLGIAHIADPILDPINFGFTGSIERYVELRKLRPHTEILMGTGNLTELTDADSLGVTAALLGIASELRITNLLIVQVSPHTRRTIEEHDVTRRVMFRSREDRTLPKGLDGRLLSLHDLMPYLSEPKDIEKMYREVKDTNFRIEVAVDGIHIYNRNGHYISQDPFDVFSKLEVEHDGSHAFYLGYELAKAEIAFNLGKRYSQDNPLDWGVSSLKKSNIQIHHAPIGEKNIKKV
ncbi:MAG: dihydropteroate synthase [Hyphomicrobium sp.]